MQGAVLQACHAQPLPFELFVCHDLLCGIVEEVPPFMAASKPSLASLRMHV
jgi:hypothetical protein